MMRNGNGNIHSSVEQRLLHAFDVSTTFQLLEVKLGERTICLCSLFKRIDTDALPSPIDHSTVYIWVNLMLGTLYWYLQYSIPAVHSCAYQRICFSIYPKYCPSSIYMSAIIFKLDLNSCEKLYSSPFLFMRWIQLRTTYNNTRHPAVPSNRDMCRKSRWRDSLYMFLSLAWTNLNQYPLRHASVKCWNVSSWIAFRTNSHPDYMDSCHIAACTIVY